MEDEQNEKSAAASGNGFIRHVLIQGTLKIGLLTILIWLTIDFVVDYSFNGIMPQYPGNYYLRTIVSGLGLGWAVGLINWILIQRAAKDSI